MELNDTNMNTSMKEDEELIGKYAWKFYGQFKRTFDAIGYNFDDVTQECRFAWVKAYKSFDSDRASFPTHFYNVTQNYLIDLFRQMAIDDEPEVVSMQDAAKELHGMLVDGPDSELFDYEKTELICTQLKKVLAERDFNIFLHYFGVGVYDQKTQDELAEEFVMTQRGVGKVIQRCIEKIKADPEVNKVLKEIQV